MIFSAKEKQNSKRDLSLFEIESTKKKLFKPIYRLVPISRVRLKAACVQMQVVFLRVQLLKLIEAFKKSEF